MKRFFVRTVAVKPRLNTIKLFSFGNIYIYCDFNYKTLKKKKKKNKKAEKLDVFRVSISYFILEKIDRAIVQDLNRGQGSNEHNQKKTCFCCSKEQKYRN